MVLDFAGGALKGDPINQKELVTLIEQALGGMSASHIFHSYMVMPLFQEKKKKRVEFLTIILTNKRKKKKKSWKTE